MVFAFVDIDLASFDTEEKNEDQRKELLDYYNSVSGSIANAVEKFIGITLEAVIAVGMLSFATEFTVYDYRFRCSRYAVVLVTAAIGYLISSELSALNVHVIPSRVTIRMAADDMVLPTSVIAMVAEDGILAPA
ncbi:hypothetical protein F442_12120 [Phytophthora nicotianae P10297]|uniref:Uncharacterized protein n=4 Tax=Phytophthora nicotianae TaxID=4792 RepID=W2Q117_PHYN3|nr:hypothetical protein PPTG_13829 [Phytophthora nicotianae INRA-310]ETL89365.1 hypothetical protein L917_11697 [Phytophthora nicotianae]ETP40620.1 hypothetical protein F442_12120 [Phytophthora nicotianae P10297]KUF83189.1 hypothetical protein AM587_10012833 [Phytophthora nicotianae]ETN05985.1 hypothetical protein PPTG_13829 [Phytophthora nicotianae INRA-310]KUF83701.1 hypothetical protein AM587_10000207 [Phytophthora nicotianae]